MMAVMLSVLNAIQIALALGYQIWLAGLFGAGPDLDAYFVSIAIPLIIGNSVSIGIGVCIVPAFAALREKRGDETAWAILTGVVLATTAALIAIAFLLGAIAPWAVAAIAPGLAEGTANVATYLLRLQLASMVTAGVFGVFEGLALANRRFVVVGMSQIAGNVAAFGVLALSIESMGIAGAALALVANSVATVAVLSIGTWRRWRIPARREYGDVARIFRDSVPGMTSALWRNGGQIVDRFVGSILPAGSITLLAYARRVVVVLSSIAARGLSAVGIEQLSALASGRDQGAFAVQSRSQMIAIYAFALPVTVGLVLYGTPIIEVLFSRGRFSSADAHLLALTLAAFAGIIIGGSMGTIVSNVFYATRDTRTPAVVTVLTFSVGLLLKIGGGLAFGVIGVALGESIYYVAAVLIMLVMLRRKTFPASDFWRAFARDAAIVTAITVASACAGWPAMRLGGPGGAFVGGLVMVVVFVGLGIASHSGLRRRVIDLLGPAIRR